MNAAIRRIDVTGGGDLFGMFHDTPQARALMRYLVTPEAQSIWVAARRRAVRQHQRHELSGRDLQARGAGAEQRKRFRFDASDLMPEQMNAAFLQAMVDYTRDPSSLDSDPRRTSTMFSARSTPTNGAGQALR